MLVLDARAASARDVAARRRSVAGARDLARLALRAAHADRRRPRGCGACGPSLRRRSGRRSRSARRRRCSSTRSVERRVRVADSRSRLAYAAVLVARRSPRRSAAVIVHYGSPADDRPQGLRQLRRSGPARHQRQPQHPPLQPRRGGRDPAVEGRVARVPGCTRGSAPAQGSYERYWNQYRPTRRRCATSTTSTSRRSPSSARSVSRCSSSRSARPARGHPGAPARARSRCGGGVRRLSRPRGRRLGLADAGGHARRALLRGGDASSGAGARARRRVISLPVRVSAARRGRRVRRRAFVGLRGNQAIAASQAAAGGADWAQGRLRPARPASGRPGRRSRGSCSARRRHGWASRPRPRGELPQGAGEEQQPTGGSGSTSRCRAVAASSGMRSRRR